MNRWVAWALALILASTLAIRVAQAQPWPGLTSASRGVVKMEISKSSSGYARQQDGRLPARPRLQAKAGCRLRDPHLGILRFAPGLGRDTASALLSDGYAGPEEAVRAVLDPVGPGPPVPASLVRFRPLRPAPGNTFSRPFRSSRPFLRRDG